MRSQLVMPWLLAGVLLVVTLWLRLPTWNDRILFIDEPILSSYAARLTLPGAHVHTHTADMKPPLGLLTYWLALEISSQHVIAVVHVLTTIAMAATVVLLVWAGAWFAYNPWGGLWAGVLYLLACSRPVGFEPLLSFSGYEHFQAPLLLGFALAYLLALQRDRLGLALLAGTALALASLYKQNTPVLLLAMWIITAVAIARGRVASVRGVTAAVAATAAFAVVFLSAPIYYALIGHFDAWWFQNVESLLRYSAGGWQQSWWARAEVLTGSLPLPAWIGVGAIYGVLGVARSDRSTWIGEWGFFALLCAVLLFASLVPGRAKAHYVIQCLPFLLSLVGSMLAEFVRIRTAVPRSLRALWAVIALGVAVPLFAQLRELYRGRSLLVDFIAQDRYLDLHRNQQTLEPLVRYIREHSQPDDLIHIHGTAPEFYFLTQRRPAASDPHNGWLSAGAPDAAKRLLVELQATPPRLLVQLGYRRYFRPFYLDGIPDVCGWLYANYRERFVADRVQVLERVDPAAAVPPRDPIVEVSDLSPSACRQVEWMRVGRSAAGTAMRIAGTLYDRGLGVRAPSLIAYDIPQGYRYLAAMVGVDDAAALADRVRFRIEVDGVARFEHVAAAGVPAVPVLVDLAGARSMVLVTEPLGADSTALSYADWAAARLIRDDISLPQSAEN